MFNKHGLKALVVMAGMISGCVHTGNVVWIDELPQDALVPQAYRIQNNDQLSVLVWNQPKLSVEEARVRSDGNVTMPLIGDVAVAGMTPVGAATQIERRLDGLVVDPKVTVTMRSGQDLAYSVLGEVRNNGTFPLRSGQTILHAVAAAGGFTQFADPNSIYVIRKDADALRIRFSYEKLTRGEGRGTQFVLRDGDIVVVE